MAIGTTNISIGAVTTELGLGTPEIGAYDLFGYSDSGAASSNAVNFHNISFGPGGADTVQNIFNPYNGQVNLSMNNWRNYSHTTNMIFSWSIQNTTRGEFELELYVERPGYGAELIQSTNLPPGGLWTGDDFDSGIASDPGVGYKIVLGYIGSDNSSPDISSANDTDGVGQGTTRSLTPLPPFVPAFQPFYDYIVAGDNSSEDIAWSKRTTFTMTI